MAFEERRKKKLGEMEERQEDWDRESKSGQEFQKKGNSIRREQQVKRQCIILGILGVILFTALTAQVMMRNQTSEVGYHTYIRQVEKSLETEAVTEGEKFLSDASAASASEDVLILVNKQNAFPEDYVVELHWLKNRSCAVSELMYDALSRMLTDGSTQGRQFVVASGYRSRETQKQLLEEDIADAMLKEGLSYEDAYARETSETMPPGYSEHETGLAVDLVALDYQILDEQQEWTEENQWLREHCSEYGFILRYPEGKEEITGVSYESWHFRYVGVEAAQEIMEQGITLEEYLENRY